MTAAARVTFALLLLTATGESVLAAESARKSEAASSPSVVLSRLQETLGRISVTKEPVAADTTALARTLTRARGRAIAEPLIAGLATKLAVAVAQGSFDDESVERLAQNLFAAVNNRELSGREGALLAVDVSSVLTEAGVDAPAIDAVIADLRAICPADAELVVGAPRRLARPAVLTRK